MDTLNNQLIKLGAREGDQVICDNWLASVIMNEFGLGLSLRSSHDPRALCDGLFPAMPSLRIWKKKEEEPAAAPAKVCQQKAVEDQNLDTDMPLECGDQFP